MTPESLGRLLEDFLGGSRHAVVLEDGARIFDPLLLLVAPTLHIHPSMDTVLRYISPEIDWTFAGIDERWRDTVRVISRKRSSPTSRSQSRQPVGVA
jgi:hypothetical protein